MPSTPEYADVVAGTPELLFSGLKEPQEWVSKLVSHVYTNVERHEGEGHASSVYHFDIHEDKRKCCTCFHSPFNSLNHCIAVLCMVAWLPVLTLSGWVSTSMCPFLLNGESKQYFRSDLGLIIALAIIAGMLVAIHTLHAYIWSEATFVTVKRTYTEERLI